MKITAILSIVFGSAFDVHRIPREVHFECGLRELLVLSDWSPRFDLG